MSATPLDWNSLATARPGTPVELEGVLVPGVDGAKTRILVPDLGCCAGCPPDPARAVELLPAAAMPARSSRVRVAGNWQVLPPDDAAGWRWRIAAARIVGVGAPTGPWMTRRAALAAPLVCVAATCAPAAPPHAQEAALRGLLLHASPADMHSHAGRVILGADPNRPLAPLAAPMREGGMALVALTMVADSPTIKAEGGRIVAWRQPAPGELYQHIQDAAARADRLVREQGLFVVTDQQGLRQAASRAQSPAVVIAAEGADFLEGQIARVAEAFQRHRLRHLQLTHYRVNELGDIQTADPVHGGLAAFGAQVIRECNRLGIVVDVAHGTTALVRRAAEVATKPMVLSHTSLTARPGPRSRQVSAEHARLVAQGGGVVGVWPPATIYPTLGQYIDGIARLADVVGIDHVGIGTDMMGLLSASMFADYRATPRVAEALLAGGFSPTDAAKVLGGNYLRVVQAVLPA
jgi:membrane dipeptidase